MNIQQQRSYKISLIGDNGIDEYFYGSVTRLSAEAPVPIFNYHLSNELPGMAANVKSNLEQLDIDVKYYFDKTCRKVRIIDLKSKQHMIRVDYDIPNNPLSASEIDLSVDAIVISDYNKGTINYDFIDDLKLNFSGPIFIDTKKTDLARISGENVFIKINEPEYDASTSMIEAGHLIVTRGSNSVLHFSHDDSINLKREYPVHEVQVFDVCGAGDTFLAWLVYGYLVDKNLDDAIKLATKAASITVQHVGVYAPTLEEVYGSNET